MSDVLEQEQQEQQERCKPRRPDNHPNGPPRYRLIELRRAKRIKAYDFAKRLGVTRTHLTNIERGRRDPSVELALKWIELLPNATLALFQPMPSFDALVTKVKALEKINPKLFKAA
jgi:DNA-binding XRE family transcriptional regulator